jgi:hypothetical protein
MHTDCASVAEFDSTGADLCRFLISMATGARCFAQTGWIRGDRALHGLLSISRFPGDDTIRNLFLRFGMGEVQRFFEPMTEWMMERVPQRAEGHSL